MIYHPFVNLIFKKEVPMRADLHSHTTYSDGHLTVEEIIRLAKRNHITVLAITDHDIVSGARLAKELNTDEALEIIVGIELSTYHNNESVHILGYFNAQSDIDSLESFLTAQQEARLVRAHHILDLLKHHFDIEVNRDLLQDYEAITRGSIADMILASGYHFTRSEIFDRFLGDGAKAYLPSTKLPTKEGIAILKKAGALTSLAHPVLLKRTKPEEIIAFGVDAIEAYYPLNSMEDTNRFKDLARRHQLLVTAGSDFHKFEDNKHGTLGQVILKNKELDRFLTALKEMEK